MNTDNVNNNNSIPFNPFPAILIGGPPNAGKSVLTYNLTRALCRPRKNFPHGIPHYVFRANPDHEGNWFLEGDRLIVDQIQENAKDNRHWSSIFRAFVCRDLAHRNLPFIVDIGGLPKDEDNCIFLACTQSILLLKEDEPEATQVWRRFATTNGLRPLAELHSQLSGESALTSLEPVITGTITKLVREEPYTGGRVFDALIERICQFFCSYSLEELENIHLHDAPDGLMVHLPHELQTIAPDLASDLNPESDQWTVDLLSQLLARHPTNTAMAVYGRAPNWVYGALALHVGSHLFHQFDARIGWITSPILQAGPRPSQQLIRVKVKPNGEDASIITIDLLHNYVDYTEAGQLLFPEPEPHHGIIVNGKLPLWLFTALARFYAQRQVPWLAFNDARDNRPVVIYSHVASHRIGQQLPALP